MKENCINWSKSEEIKKNSDCSLLLMHCHLCGEANHIRSMYHCENRECHRRVCEKCIKVIGITIKERSKRFPKSDCPHCLELCLCKIENEKEIQKTKYNKAEKKEQLDISKENNSVIFPQKQEEEMKISQELNSSQFKICSLCSELTLKKDMYKCIKCLKVICLLCIQVLDKEQKVYRKKLSRWKCWNCQQEKENKKKAKRNETQALTGQHLCPNINSNHNQDNVRFSQSLNFNIPNYNLAPLIPNNPLSFFNFSNEGMLSLSNSFIYSRNILFSSNLFIPISNSLFNRNILRFSFQYFQTLNELDNKTEDNL